MTLGSRYRRLLQWSFDGFNGLRVFSYLPMLAAIQASGDSNQHSLLTWGVWLGANTTMAAWLFERNARRCDRAVVVTLLNAAMCAAVIALIVAHR